MSKLNFYMLCRPTREIFIKIADMDMASTHGQMEASFLGLSTWTEKRVMECLPLGMVTDFR